GPSMFAVITNGVSRGFIRAFIAGVGIAAGDAVLVILALLGLVALAQTFEWVFLALKYAGAAYLVFLGIKMWRSAMPLGKATLSLTQVARFSSISRARP
ncbi:LysE family transporter, partial [Mesorhizobium sp. M4B.F.Ca.ET.200.01.1.1]|uniref:LysE family translocator n=1 Tax=Mesorhizobium sp. M4B.F.Ca.ET.200.01.1.1 TaxID=2563952 RepID=UPI001FE19225